MTVKQRYTGIQDIAADLHTDGCHFLTLCSIAEEENIRLKKINPNVDLIDAIKISQSKGWFTSEFEGKDALAFLNYLTGQKWTRTEIVTELPPHIADNEYTEVIYYNKTNGYKHFRRRGFDTLWDSKTVKCGKILGYYIYTSLN